MAYQLPLRNSVTPNLEAVAHKAAAEKWADRLEKIHGTEWTDEYYRDTTGYVRAQSGLVLCPGCGEKKEVHHVNREGLVVPKFMVACKPCFDDGRRSWYWEAETVEDLLGRMNR